MSTNAEYYPTHDRTSCSDTDACNATAEGSTGCARCTAIAMDQADTLDCPACGGSGHIGDVQAAVEPVPDDIVAGALYDFLGYLTTRRTRITMSDRDDAGAAVDALVDWSKTRNINLTEARVRDWNRYTSQPDHTKAIRLALEIIRLQREWIMAVPQDTVLPSMPGFDREWVDRQIAALEKELT